MGNDMAILDPDIVAALIAAQRPDAAADAAVLERVRARVLRHIASDSAAQHVTVTNKAGNWHGFLPGIQRKVLHEQHGVMSYLLKFAPGAVLPAHRHPMDEECIVLEGALRIGDVALSAGGFHLARQGLPHADIVSDAGAVIYLHGASPRAEHLV
jgi:quercetin dioxygenase-like cupin family protein